MNPCFFSFCASLPKSLSIILSSQWSFTDILSWFAFLAANDCFSCNGWGTNIMYPFFLSACFRKNTPYYWWSQRLLQDRHWLVIIFRVFSKAANVGTLSLINVLLLSSVFYAQTFCSVCGQEDLLFLLSSQEWSWTYTFKMYFPFTLTTPNCFLRLRQLVFRLSSVPNPCP